MSDDDLRALLARAKVSPTVQRSYERRGQRIVINTDFGTMALSVAAVEWMNARGHNLTAKRTLGSGVSCIDPLPRDHPDLVAVVEALGDEASGQMSRLRIVDIPPGVDWVVCEYDGLEWVAERHRRWNQRGEMSPHEPYTWPRG